MANMPRRQWRQGAAQAKVRAMSVAHASTDATRGAAMASWSRTVAPGVLLAGAVSGLAWGGAWAEALLFGHALLEALVLAILIGMGVRAAWGVGPRWGPGIRLAAKPFLEVAIVGLGASVNLPALLRAGPILLGGIAVIVVAAIGLSYGASRLLGLPHRLAVLVACGNSICGNAAIAAVAPVIRAEDHDVASSLAFTNILGIGLVLLLPVAGHAMGLSFYQYGVVAGLTVYAVPQVVAATFPVSALSGQVGTLVKLSRVLLLGPVVLTLAIGHRGRGGGPRLKVRQFVPWFIVVFLGLAALRSTGLLGDSVMEPIHSATTWLMVMAMAGMGLGVDVRGLAKMGTRVTLAAAVSLAALMGASLALIGVLGVR
jgi:uncharacterized integral membrane protein (TIGR00698 family)